MHNIKDIRKDFNNFKEKLKNRNIDTDLDNIRKEVDNAKNTFRKYKIFNLFYFFMGCYLE